MRDGAGKRDGRPDKEDAGRCAHHAVYKGQPFGNILAPILIEVRRHSFDPVQTGDVQRDRIERKDSAIVLRPRDAARCFSGHGMKHARVHVAVVVIVTDNGARRQRSRTHGAVEHNGESKIPVVAQDQEARRRGHIHHHIRVTVAVHVRRTHLIERPSSPCAHRRLRKRSNRSLPHPHQLGRRRHENVRTTVAIEVHSCCHTTIIRPHHLRNSKRKGHEA